MSLNDVQLSLADVAIIIILARLLGIAAKRLGQPPVLGEILAGILLGPTFFHEGITKALFPPALIAPLTALADLGLILFMFVVGYELDLRLIRGRGRVAVGVSAGSVILPLGLGAALGVWLAHRKHLHDVSTFALFIGTALAAARCQRLVLTGGDGRRSRRVAGLSQRGIQASSGPAPEGSLLVAGEDRAAAGGVHLTVRAGSSEDLEARPEIATPVSELEQGRP